ncbi:DUF6602 domain-containing protein [Ramlibacter sp. MMS24-I3-19]|uniref:DUF6602 domain-containing protein n=1 Tax=Ramlibacter sp. MMS24-I3-19 TaxID=3416606 RepID=UPI003CFDAE36
MQNDNEQDQHLLKNFRRVVRSHVEMFKAQRDHVHDLLGGRHHYSSGAFRESLLKTFLSTLLPRSVSVDSGFVYGFEQVPNSKQIDVLIWNSSSHSAVFRAGDFVIVPPESVIAAITVKSTLDGAAIREALDNLRSLVELDLIYRTTEDEHGTLLQRPIFKAVVAYDTKISVQTLLTAAGNFYSDLFASDGKLTEALCGALKEFDPLHPSREHVSIVQRVLPGLISVISDNELSLYRGWGPPDDITGEKRFGPGLRRLPYLYAQRSELTSPLEKLVYHVLTATYAALGTVGWSLVSAWGELDPICGFRGLDIDELDKASGVPLLDPTRLARAT